ncbi:hypothetical protein [Streptomyces cadmiisoli]|uniref:hypothetical protein n=1 Tax=Streptomyces cadmiisoli TaxID=2184053 RepID=UPI003D74A0BE
MTETWRLKPPPVTELDGWQYLGWHCCWCGSLLREGARSAGRAEGHSGAHDLSIEVYECDPPCPERPTEIEPE